MDRQGGKVDWVSVLRKAALEGKNALLQSYNPDSRKKIVGTGAGGDQTLAIDKASENAIHRALDQQLGRDSYIFVSEEIGEVRTSDDRPKPVIICDPLDGSYNAEVGIPFFAVSLSVLGIGGNLGIKDRRTFGDVDAGLIQSIPTNDVFSSLKGFGSYHGSSKLEARSEKPGRIGTLLVECSDVDQYRKLTQRFSNEYIYKTRLLGSAALSFCLLASGTADGFIFSSPGGARTIDSPAGYLIAKEAGCAFADLSGKSPEIDDVEVGFHSRLSLVGASNREVLAMLLSKVGQGL